MNKPPYVRTTRLGFVVVDKDKRSRFYGWATKKLGYAHINRVFSQEDAHWLIERLEAYRERHEM